MTESHYIVQDGEFSLWCDRSNGKLVPKEGMVECKFRVINRSSASVCIGLVLWTVAHAAQLMLLGTDVIDSNRGCALITSGTVDIIYQISYTYIVYILIYQYSLLISRFLCSWVVLF